MTILDFILSLFTSKPTIDIMTFGEGITVVSGNLTSVVTVVSGSLTGVT
jgi:hypothetical protein